MYLCISHISHFWGCLRPSGERRIRPLREKFKRDMLPLNSIYCPNNEDVDTTDATALIFCKKNIRRKKKQVFFYSFFVSERKNCPLAFHFFTSAIGFNRSQVIPECYEHPDFSLPACVKRFLYFAEPIEIPSMIRTNVLHLIS